MTPAIAKGNQHARTHFHKEVRPQSGQGKKNWRKINGTELRGKESLKREEGNLITKTRSVIIARKMDI